MTEEQTPPEGQPVAERGENRSQRPASEAFRAFVAGDWGPRPDRLPQRVAAAPFAAERRRRLRERFPDERIVVPAGPLVTRSNDTDYRFRPHSAFAYLTGLGTDREPDAVLVLHPGDRSGGAVDQGHDVLYFRPRAERDTEEFYADTRYGELWVGVRPSLAELQAETGIRCAHIEELPAALSARQPAPGPASDAGDPEGVRGVRSGTVPVRVVPGADRRIEDLVAQARRSAGPDAVDAADAADVADVADVAETVDAADAALAEALAELRLVKDAHEIEQMRRAVAATVDGFRKIVASLPRAAAHARGERVIEGAFGSHAREEGNAVGYETIAASGNHACTLHWVRNDGRVQPGDLVLVDAGVEVDSLYTADVTRTLPVDGTFTPAQRQVYQAVLDAADAALAVVRPGATLRDVHAAAMAVIADRLHAWGWLPGSAEESLAPEGQFHRRWMVHGTSHHLGIDVHDCAQARREAYLEGALAPGMIFTVEPGLYIRADDLAAPPDFRGIGVRIEDDVLVTHAGYENLSAALPRSVDDVEGWVRRARAAALSGAGGC